MRSNPLLLALLLPSLLLSATADAKGKKPKTDLNLIRDEDNFSRHFDDEVAADRAREDGAAAPASTRKKKSKSSSKKSRKSRSSEPQAQSEAEPTRATVEDMKL
jgi:hypothetical protein